MAARRCSCTRCLRVNDATTPFSLCHDRRRHSSGGGTPRAGSTNRRGKRGYEIADVLNYVSNAWDNGKSLPSGFKPFTSDEIKALRAPELTSAQVYALRSRAAGDRPATATADGAGGTVQ